LDGCAQRSSAGKKRADEYTTRLLRALATGYPNETDASIARALKDAKARPGDAEGRLYKMLSKCFAGTRHEPLEYDLDGPFFFGKTLHHGGISIGPMAPHFMITVLLFTNP
jgi:hypothetical protein